MYYNILWLSDRYQIAIISWDFRGRVCAFFLRSSKVFFRSRMIASRVSRDSRDQTVQGEGKISP